MMYYMKIFYNSFLHSYFDVSFTEKIFYTVDILCFFRFLFPRFGSNVFDAIYFIFSWFDAGINKWTGKEGWIYNNKYFDRDWSSCPDIF